MTDHGKWRSILFCRTAKHRNAIAFPDATCSLELLMILANHAFDDKFYADTLQKMTP